MPSNLSVNTDVQWCLLPSSHFAVVACYVAATVRGSDEDVWAQALREYDGPTRRQGLWAKSYAAAEGDAARTKAAYLRERVAQLSRATSASEDSSVRAHPAQRPDEGPQRPALAPSESIVRSYFFPVRMALSSDVSHCALGTGVAPAQRTW